MSMVFVGGGNMAEAILKGLLRSGVVACKDVLVVDVLQERLDYLSLTYKVGVSTELVDVVGSADSLVLAVKPQGLMGVLGVLSPHLPDSCLVVSIAAGIRCEAIEKRLALGQRVVRVMPNTPSLVGMGAAAVAPGSSATQDDLALVFGWMEAVGVVVTVDESAMDAVTALSGSGPAYGFYLLEGMLQAAAKMGLDATQARLLAAATLEGAAVMVREGADDPGVLRERVTSKGGTTAAALDVLDAAGVQAAIVCALEAACARSKELSADA